MRFRQRISATDPLTALGQGSVGVPPHHYHPRQVRTTFTSTQASIIGSNADLLPLPQPFTRPPRSAAQTERFVVESGTMGYVIEGEEKLLYPGEKLAIAPGLRHTWWVHVEPGTPEDLVVVLTADPANGSVRPPASGSGVNVRFFASWN